MKGLFSCAALCALFLSSCASLFNQVKPDELDPTPAELAAGYWEIRDIDDFNEIVGYVYFLENGYILNLDKFEDGEFSVSDINIARWSWTGDTDKIRLYNRIEDMYESGEYYLGELKDLNTFLFHLMNGSGVQIKDDDSFLVRAKDFQPGNILIEKNSELNFAGKCSVSEVGFDLDDAGEAIFFADGTVRGNEEFFGASKFSWIYNGEINAMIWSYDEYKYDFGYESEYANTSVLDVLYSSDDKIELADEWGHVYLTKIKDADTEEQQKLSKENYKLKLKEWEDKRIAYNKLLEE